MSEPDRAKLPDHDLYARLAAMTGESLEAVYNLQDKEREELFQVLQLRQEDNKQGDRVLDYISDDEALYPSPRHSRKRDASEGVPELPRSKRTKSPVKEETTSTFSFLSVIFPALLGVWNGSSSLAERMKDLVLGPGDEAEETVEGFLESNSESQPMMRPPFDDRDVKEVVDKKVSDLVKNMELAGRLQSRGLVHQYIELSEFVPFTKDDDIMKKEDINELLESEFVPFKKDGDIMKKEDINELLETDDEDYLEDNKNVSWKGKGKGKGKYDYTYVPDSKILKNKSEQVKRGRGRPKGSKATKLPKNVSNENESIFDFIKKKSGAQLRGEDGYGSVGCVEGGQRAGFGEASGTHIDLSAVQDQEVGASTSRTHSGVEYSPTSTLCNRILGGGRMETRSSNMEMGNSVMGTCPMCQKRMEMGRLKNHAISCQGSE